MRRGTILMAAVATAVLTACGGAEVVVTAEIEATADGQPVTRPLGDLQIQLVPFDRDAVFDSLSAAYGLPEPEIPAELLEAQGRVAAAQEEWRSAEAAWGDARDRLQTINQELGGLSRGEGRYRLLFGEFQDQEARMNQAERVKDQAFARFTALQDSIIGQQQEIRLLREDWEDQAFADYPAVLTAKTRDLRRQIVTDTTDASGVVRISAQPGQWWVHARYELPFVELYWNQPVTVERGEPVTVRLNRTNAQERPKL